MLVSGFTFIRNAATLGYPYLESIQSLLLLCDEVVVAVGEGNDDTLTQIKKITDPRLRIIETTWNENMCDRGYVYAQQKMIAQFNCRGKWVVYLEADEILHEQDIELIRNQIVNYLDQPQVEAIAFDYYHFYGSPQHIVVSPRWYKRAVRIIRNSIRTFAPDGLFWLVMAKNRRGRYPNAVLANCHIYHYGHVRKACYMNEKGKQVEKYWGNIAGEFSNYGNIDATTVYPFQGTHPLIIHNWLVEKAEKAENFIINPHYNLTGRDRRHRFLSVLERWLNRDFSHKHYRLIKI